MESFSGPMLSLMYRVAEEAAPVLSHGERRKREWLLPND